MTPPSTPEPSAPQYGAPPVPPSAPVAPQAPYGSDPQAPYGSAPQAPYGAAPTAPYGAAPTAPYGQAPQAPQGGNGLAIASVVVGGIGLLLAIIGFGLIPAIVGLVLGIVALVKKKGSRLLALIGTIVSGLGVLIGIVVVILGLIVAGATVDAINESLPESGSVASEAPVADDETVADDSAGANLTFGETFTYEDGLALTVSAPEPYTPGEYAFGAEQAANVLLTVTIVNGTTENFDPTLAYPSVSSAGVEGDDIIDSDAGLNLAPQTAVPAGQTITWQVAFSVADAAQMVLEISPSPFDYESVVYTS